MSAKSEPKSLKQPKPSSNKPFTAQDLAKEVKLPSAAIARRYLRAAKVTRPTEGWSWGSREAAKGAIEAVQRRLKAETPKT